MTRRTVSLLCLGVGGRGWWGVYVGAPDRIRRGRVNGTCCCWSSLLGTSWVSFRLFQKFLFASRSRELVQFGCSSRSATVDSSLGRNRELRLERCPRRPFLSGPFVLSLHLLFSGPSPIRSGLQRPPWFHGRHRPTAAPLSRASNFSLQPISSTTLPASSSCYFVHCVLCPALLLS